MKYSKSTDDPTARGDVQSYLLAKYREALKKADKSFAKSCLLSTRLFSVDDPTISNEIYSMADGDIGEAAKCFADMFENLFKSDKSIESLSSEALMVVNQIKEETRFLLNELKNQHLKLKSATVVIGSNRQVSSVNQSPLLRMSSEDRCTSRESILRLDKHLNSTNKTIFYQKLLDNLNEDVRRNILDHSINDCENQIERCRLMMLSISLFSDSVVQHGHGLLRTLMQFSDNLDDSQSTDCDRTLGVPRNLGISQHAQSMLILDAIPMIFSLQESKNLDFDLDELLKRTLNYYSEYCLERSAEEYEFRELHEGLRKAIAARILAKDITYSASEEALEESLKVCLKLLLDRFSCEFTNDITVKQKLEKLRELLESDDLLQPLPSDDIKQLLVELELEDNIPENILFNTGKEENTSSSQTTTATPPPKGRGRPKKVQTSVIVSPDDGVQRHLHRKAKESLFVYSLFLQHMFNNSSLYLKQTRSRILMHFDNPLAGQVETDIIKNASQRSLRGKSSSNDSTPSKKMKMDAQALNESAKSSDSHSSDDVDEGQEIDESPLELEHSKKIDREIVDILLKVHKSMLFLKTESPTFERLFSRFLTTLNSRNLKWFWRIHVDCMVISRDFTLALNSLDKIMTRQDENFVKRERDVTEPSTLTVSTGTSPSVEVYHLRALAQTVCCNIQLLNKNNTLNSMIDLWDKIKHSGLLTCDTYQSTGHVIEEYKIVLSKAEEPSFGFLFFDALSLLRYNVVVLMDILERYINHSTPNSDLMIGHAIVLSQMDWPKQVHIYDSCISWIRTTKPKSTTPQCLSASTKFTYPNFFNFILEPSILEDFMALLNEGITLDIKKPGSATSPGGNITQQNSSTASSRSSAGSTRSGKAITTRGVNKTFKEDLKVALVAQMKTSSSFYPLDLMADFIQGTLVPHLSLHK